ncbi:hypothetical protein [Cupriavidus basilensis]|uniref:hypothetical protein n=1 Tax=Cupriavidus basilensis TaxID=68895 RepID=UPI00157B0008|nr:hypothetical protein [Cupriavidus basilensis]NUA28967.1 hypothetical protein [Cupriavidus basilensis]
MLSRSLPYARPAAVGRQARVTVFGRIFILVFLLAVFEGAARKWVSDSLTMPLILLRDLLTVYSLYYAMRYAGFTPALRSMRLLLWWSAIVCFWGLLQLVAGINSLPVFLIGIRFWLLYLWFACAAAELLEEQDLAAIYNVAIGLLLLMAPLVLVQHFLSPEHFLNRQIEGDPDTVFRVTGDVVRTTGTFSFTMGYTLFLAIISPIVLEAVMGAPKAGLWSKLRSLVIMGSLFLATLVSGSRAAVLLLPILFGITLAANLVFGKGGRRKTAVSWAFVSIVMSMVIVLFLSSAVDATLERFSSAAQMESFGDRVESMFFGVNDVSAEQSLLGSGLGLGSNLANYFLQTGLLFVISETETGRVIGEMGLVGYLSILLKALIFINGMWRALRVARRTGNSFLILMWTVAIFGLTSWPVVGQLTANALGFVFAGITLAATRQASQRLYHPG